MEIKLMPKAEEDLAYWKAVGNVRIMKRITRLLADILEHPFTGITIILNDLNLCR